MKLITLTPLIRLPKGLEYLTTARYRAVHPNKVGRKLVWHVEIEVTTHLNLLKVKKNCSKIRSKNALLTLTIRQQETYIEELLMNKANLEAVNARLMKNIDEDNRPDRFVKSPKSYLNVAEERAFKTNGNFPVQGGTGGLNKK